MQCPCGLDRPFAECCERLIQGAAKAANPEELMRARYSAFATQAIDFIHESHEPSSRGQLDRNSTAEWSKQSEWVGFELLETEGGGADDEDGKVEFIARYKIKGNELAHHETAIFRKVDGDWYFVDGELAKHETFARQAPKVGRNDPCPCGSGKKVQEVLRLTPG